MTENEKFLLDDYRETVREMLRTGLTRVIPNYDSKHASIILEEMIRATKENFVAVTQQMSGEVWTEEILSLLCSRRTQNKVNVSILTVDAPPEQLPAELSSSVRRLQTATGTKPFKYNFAVSDGKSFRFENDIAKRTAIFCANNLETSSTLIEAFEALSRRSGS